MRILFLSPRQCWPVRSGAKLREYHFARALARAGELTYVQFTDPGATPLTRDDLPFCHELAAIPKPPAYGTANLIQGVLTKWPVTILNYHSAAMTAAVQRLTTGQPFDVIHFDAIHVMQYGPAVQRPPRAIVYNWHNIESEAMQRYSETIDSLPRRLYAQLTAAKLRHREDEILRSARGHVVCSERERAQLLQSHPSASIAVVENGVDVAYFAEPQAAPRDAGQTLVFVGSMDYFPNQEACISFANHIWPRVRTAFPQLRLVLVGSNPPPSVTALGQLEGITVTGTVPDVRPYYQNAVAAIIPIRTGSGTRLKILEALAAGVPVISSPLGAEGLAVTPGKNILMADPADPGQWIQHLTALANTPSLARQLADEGRALVRERYDWETLGQKLVDTYRGWL